MNDDRLELICGQCSWSVVCDQAEMLRRLRNVRILIREADPPPDLVSELFHSAGDRLRCDQCGATELGVQRPTEDDVDWGQSMRCDRCGRAIPSERLEVFPDTTTCAACQAKTDQGELNEGFDYCPRCGAHMSPVASSRGGTTQYRLKCGECGYAA